LRIRDVYPGSRILIFVHPGSRIPDPTSTKEEGNKSLVSYLFVATNMTKFKFDLFLNRYRKNLSQFTKNYSAFFLQKLPLRSQKYGFGIRDPGSRKSLFRIPDLRSRAQKGTGSATLL
jgi:hypothetical protein